MKFGAIDIGSNGARLLISRVLTTRDALTGSIQVGFKDIEYTRFPLRLGEDVFHEQRISERKREQLLKLMQAFAILMDLHEVDDYCAFATSAFREARNGNDMVRLVKKHTGIKIDVIEGAREAEILGMAIYKTLDDNYNYLHIDVGGGSTELNIYLGKQKIAARSFPIGSIRNEGGRESIKVLKDMQKWLEEQKKFLPSNASTRAIGTGGNINKIYNLIKPANGVISDMQIHELQIYLNKFSYSDKINILKLNPDRADTIVPASNLYLSAMHKLGITEMQVPELGLKDGILEILLARHKERLIHHLP